MKKITADILLGITGILTLLEAKKGSRAKVDKSFFQRLIQEAKNDLERRKTEETEWRAEHTDLIERWKNGDQTAWVEISTLPMRS